MGDTVHVLHLSGLDSCEASQAVETLLTDRSVPDLRKLLVVDDTRVLVEHAKSFEKLLTSGRMSHLLCIGIGPAHRDSRTITLPGNIGSAQGSAILWVGDPIGVDWQLATAASATTRPDGEVSGLYHLIEVLSCAEVFSRVRDLVVDLPDGVASPGIKLDEASEMSSDFASVLATVIRKIVEPQPGQAGRTDLVEPLAVSLAKGATLSQNGVLRSARLRCGTEAEAAVTAAEDVARFGSLLGIGHSFGQARDQVIAAGRALREFRDLVRDLFEFAHAPGGLTDRQARRLHDTGIQLTSQTPAVPPGIQPPSGQQATDPITKAALDAVRSGEGLPYIADQLTLAERTLRPRGSRSYLVQLDQLCPAALVDRLIDPPSPPGPQSWLLGAGALVGVLGALGGMLGIATGTVLALAWTGLVALSTGARAGAEPGKARMALLANLITAVAGVAIGVLAGFLAHPKSPVVVAGLVLAVIVGLAAITVSWRDRARAWQTEVRPNIVGSTADSITELVIMVAGKEWTADTATLETVARTRITVEAIRDELTDYAGDAAIGGSDPTRLGASFEPTLRDLVTTVIMARPAAGHPDGQAAYRQVRARTDELIRQWDSTAKDRGPLARPAFATARPDDNQVQAADLALITVAANADPSDVMWQLCAPEDLTMLDAHGRKAVVAFAPAMVQSALSTALPMDTVWTSSGQYAGLLRLVALRPGTVHLDWSTTDEPEPVP